MEMENGIAVMNNFAVAYNAAKEKKEAESSNISALLNFQVKIFSLEDIKKKAKEASQRKKDAQIIADKMKNAEDELRKIEEIEGWEDHPDLASRYNELSNYLGNIHGMSDKHLQGSIDVAKLIKDIQATDPGNKDDVVNWLKKIADIGRGDLMDITKAEKKMHEGRIPEGYVKFDNLCLLHKRSKIHPEKIASPADQSIFKALRELVSRYYKNKFAVKKNAIERLKKVGNPNLTAFKDNKPGVYRVYLPEKGKKGQPDYQSEGIGIIELIDNGKFLAVKAVEGAGSLSWIAANKGDWVPLSAVFTGKVFENKIPANNLEFAKKFARTLHFHVFRNGNGCY